MIFKVEKKPYILAFLLFLIIKKNYIIDFFI